MNKEVLIIKNISREGPGILEEVLKENSISYTLTDMSTGQRLPSVNKISALVVLGGPASANDATAEMIYELDYIRSALNENIPYLGICLGLQILVKSAGGKVVISPVKETGFKNDYGKNFTVELTEDGKKDPLFNGIGHSVKVFHLHSETVELIHNMTLLGTGKDCYRQIVRVGINAYGIQCHFELTSGMFEQWLNEDPDLIKLNKEQLRKDYNEIKSEYTKTGRRLFTNFLNIAGLI